MITILMFLMSVFLNAQKFRDINKVNHFQSLRINNIFIPNNNLPFQKKEIDNFLITISENLRDKNISYEIGYLEYREFKIQKIGNFSPEYLFIIENYRNNIKVFKIVNFYSFEEIWKGFIRTDNGKKIAKEIIKQLE